MKWKNEIPNKFEFMKVNSFNFIENEKCDSSLVHEKNAGKLIFDGLKQQKESKSHGNLTSISPTPVENKENIEENIDKIRTTMSKTITLTQSRTDFEGSAPKRYTTKCYLKPVSRPVWYRESVHLKIGSTKRTYTEHAFFQNKFVPVYWGENMATEVKTSPKCVISEIDIPRDEDDDAVHYISLEPQQRAAALKSTDL